MRKLDIDVLREQLDKAAIDRGRRDGVQSRQVLALFEVLVDAINEAIEAEEHISL